MSAMRRSSRPDASAICSRTSFSISAFSSDFKSEIGTWIRCILHGGFILGWGPTKHTAWTYTSSRTPLLGSGSCTCSALQRALQRATATALHRCCEIAPGRSCTAGSRACFPGRLSESPGLRCCAAGRRGGGAAGRPVSPPACGAVRRGGGAAGESPGKCRGRPVSPPPARLHADRPLRT
ncbi:hypothetical protein EYF80_047815 [Liparis tanakae]|uniref:Uncharacterized protein n=1 Tax=Liparis tanakae TaxID=230148 RepID=A0A4Z2FMM0_9TELE|nr:hypothetical protein EYF80_047815 [Liparis tanakae]